METSERNMSRPRLRFAGSAPLSLGPATAAATSAAAEPAGLTTTRGGIAAGDRNLHAAADRADVAGHDSIASLESRDDLRHPESFVRDAHLHRRDVDRLV